MADKTSLSTGTSDSAAGARPRGRAGAPADTRKDDRMVLAGLIALVAVVAVVFLVVLVAGNALE